MKRPGRPPLDASGIPPAAVHLKLPATDYDRAFLMATAEGISVPELIRNAMEVDFMTRDDSTVTVSVAFRAIRARRNAEQAAMHAEQLATMTMSRARRRTRLRQGFVERIRRDVVYSRHGGICGICGDPVDADDFHVDHVIPLAKGGQHTYGNTQPSHPGCNARKHARVGFSLKGNR